MKHLQALFTWLDCSFARFRQPFTVARFYLFCWDRSEELWGVSGLICLVIAFWSGWFFLLALCLLFVGHTIHEIDERRAELAEARRFEPPNVYGNNEYVSDERLGRGHL
jgi:hypothetical protein